MERTKYYDLSARDQIPLHTSKVEFHYVQETCDAWRPIEIMAVCGGRVTRQEEEKQSHLLVKLPTEIKVSDNYKCCFYILFVFLPLMKFEIAIYHLTPNLPVTLNQR